MGKFDLNDGSIYDVFDGTSSDFKSAMTGLMECGVNTETQVDTLVMGVA
jgi:hypothetical protein